MAAVDPALTSYEAWLRRRGAGQGTIVQYLSHAARAVGGQDPVERLSDRKLSPKYRRMCRAAALSYARFSKNEKLIEEIGEVRLPAPVRKTAKVPLSESAWRALRAEIDSADYIKEPVRAVLGLMATRGLRRGDVLRLRKTEVTGALKKDVLSYVAKGERRLEFGVLKSFRPYLELLSAEFTERRAGADDAVCGLIALRAVPENQMASAGEAVTRGLVRVGEAVGADVLEIDPEDLHCHQLRRSVANMYFKACNHNPMELKSWMQWASMETALSYVDHADRDKLDAIADSFLG
jgi:integrase